MRARFVQGAVQKHGGTKQGVNQQLANWVFDVVAKFVGYGFCRSHAAAFARTVYQSAYLKAHHPAAFMAAVMEHKPGFYPLNTVLEEARHCGVQILPVDVHCSDVKYRIENGAIRLPLTQVKGLSVEAAASLVLERAQRSFGDIDECYGRVSLPRDVWDNLARSGAFSSYGARRDVGKSANSRVASAPVGRSNRLLMKQRFRGKQFLICAICRQQKRRYGIFKRWDSRRGRILSRCIVRIWNAWVP